MTDVGYAVVSPRSQERRANLFAMRPSARLLPLFAAGILLTAALAGCSNTGPTSEPSWQPTPLPSFEAGTVRIQRDDFCAGVSPEAVESAVGMVESTGHYGNGESAELADGVKDVSHEFNCTFVGADGRAARAWLFVPEVTPDRARDLVAKVSSKQTGCTTLPGEGFGFPSTSTVCRTADATVATYHGLFTDAWLSCSLTVPDPKTGTPALRKAAGEWCVAAAQAAETA